MRFRDTTQKALVCSALMREVGLPDCWGARGPRGEAWRIPTGEADARVILQICWSIWGDVTTFPFSDLGGLAPRRLQAVGELLIASARGVEAIDAWLVSWGGVERRVAPVASQRPATERRDLARG